MILCWLLAGGAIGALNGASRRWTVARLRPEAPRDALGLVWGGLALRWGLVAALLIIALQRGVVAGLLAFVGLSLARWVMVIWFSFSPSPSP